MVFDGIRIYDDFHVVHLDSLTIAQSLIFDESYEFHHFTMRLDLSHVFLDSKLFAAEQSTLLSSVDVQTGESVFKKVRSAVVIVSFNHDICHRRRQLLLLLLELDSSLAEIVRVYQNVVVVTRLVSEGLGDHMLF